MTPTSAARLRDVAARARECRRCDLWRRASQTVFGEGSPRAPLMIVGEQPGDVEDREGRPFVGPAGRLLRDVLAEIGIGAASVYVTNAVKHFKWEPRGKRRIHKRPNQDEVLACHLWLDEEIRAVQPRAIVALGATAAAALFGASVRVTRDRGRLLASPLAPLTAVTIHPSAVLRTPDAAARKLAREQLRDDLRAIWTRLRNGTMSSEE